MDLLNPGIEPGSPALQADSLPTELSGKPFAILSSAKLHFVINFQIYYHTVVNPDKKLLISAVPSFMFVFNFICIHFFFFL